MRYVIVYYCAADGCDCLDRNGVIAYDGFDQWEAESALRYPPASYEARDESASYN